MARKTAREIAKEISENMRKPEFVGPKSKEVIIQEIWSLKNTKPAFRKPDYETRMRNFKLQLTNKFGLEYSDKMWGEIFK